MDGARRRECLRTLKALGYQTGAGMMVGSPGQTWDCLLDDIAFLEELAPEMIGTVSYTHLVTNAPACVLAGCGLHFLPFVRVSPDKVLS